MLLAVTERMFFSYLILQRDGSKCCAVAGGALPLITGKNSRLISVSMALDVVHSCASQIFLEIALDVLSQCGSTAGDIQDYKACQLRPPGCISNIRLFSGETNDVPAKISVFSSLKDMCAWLFLR